MQLKLSQQKTVHLESTFLAEQENKVACNVADSMVKLKFSCYRKHFKNLCQQNIQKEWSVKL